MIYSSFFANLATFFAVYSAACYLYYLMAFTASRDIDYIVPLIKVMLVFSVGLYFLAGIAFLAG